MARLLRIAQRERLITRFGYALSIVLVLIHGCDGGRLGASAKAGRHGTATVGGGVISTVDGHPIAVSEVQELVAAGLSPRVALARLQAERLLMADAERRGFGRLASVALVAEQARVQALLEAEADAVVASEQELRAAYAANLSRFEKPERRGSVHILAALPKNATPAADAAAKAFAERALRELAQTTDLEALLAGQHKQSTAEFQVIAERIPPTDREGKVIALVRPYLDALFSVAGLGVVAAPVRSEFGWHAVRVTEIVPHESTPFEQAAETLRAEMLLVRRKERVQKLVEQLRKTYRVEIPTGVGLALAKLSL